MLFTLKVFLAGIGLAIIESTFMKAGAIAGIKPDLAVLAVVVATSRTDFRRALGAAFLLGITRDFFSAGFVGMNAMSLTLMAYLLIAAEDYLMTDNRAAQMVFVFVGSMIFGTTFALLKLVMQYEPGPIMRMVEIIFWTSVYTSLLAPIPFMLMKRPQLLPYTRLRLKHYVEHETIPEIKT